MIRVNFITAEYQSKLFLKNFVTLSLLLIIMYVGVIMGVGKIMDIRLEKAQERRTKKIEEIKVTNENIAKKREEANNIEDLSNKIKIIEDILNQRKYGLSEVLFQLKETIPEYVWLDKLTYSKNILTITGVASEDRKERLSPEKNLLRFERNMKNVERYHVVIPESSQASNIKGTHVQKFKYTVEILKGSLVEEKIETETENVSDETKSE